MYSRNVPAMDTKTKPKIWKLTNAQWSVYYWLLAHSKRNPSGQEDHYYIYRNSFTLAQIRKGTGIKSDVTVRSAIQKLQDESIEALILDPLTGAYIIQPPRLFVAMNASIILGLLAFNQYIDTGLTITAFAILARMHKFSEGKETPQFTKTEFAALMGFAKQNVDDAGIVLILYLLKGLGLIDFHTKSYDNRVGVKCQRYYLDAAYPMSNAMDGLLNSDDDEESEKRSQQHIAELWNLVLGAAEQEENSRSAQ